VPGPQLAPKTAERELVNHYKLQHANIVGFRQAMLTEAHLCIVVELCVRESLIEFVLKQPRSPRTGRPCASEAQTRVATQQMLCAVAYAHANGVVHRDLKARHAVACVRVRVHRTDARVRGPPAQLCNTLLVEPATPGGTPTVKICDWGYSRSMSVDTAARTFVGTSCACARCPLAARTQAPLACFA
jgi:serine/threonine protein kinase